MSSTYLPEDLVRTLSHLVFACITPGTATLKLLDPTTGVLGDYLLVKVMPEAKPRSGRRPRQAKTHPPTLPILNELVERLKTAVLENFSSSKAVKKPSPLLPPRLIRKTPHAQLSRTTAIALFDSSRSDESDVQSPTGSLAQLKQALLYGGNRDMHTGGLSRPPPSPLAFSSDGSSLLLADKHPSDADNSSITDHPAILHKSSPSSLPCLRLDSNRQPTASNWQNTSSDTDFSPICPSAPRLGGLGFSNLLKDNGTPFDGLGTLVDGHYSCMSSASPSDEARARAVERRGLRRHQVNQDRDEEFGFAAKTSTPHKASAILSRPTPDAPPRRVIGRLPVDLERRPARRRSDPKVAPDSAARGNPQPLKAVAGVSARRDGRRSFKPSPILVGPPSGEQLRVWSNWTTPVGEKAGERRPSWRP